MREGVSVTNNSREKCVFFKLMNNNSNTRDNNNFYDMQLYFM